MTIGPGLVLVCPSGSDGVSRGDVPGLVGLLERRVASEGGVSDDPVVCWVRNLSRRSVSYCLDCRL